MPRQTDPDSRRARLEALNVGKDVQEHEVVAEMDDVPAIVKRLHRVWSTAIARVKLDYPLRTFSCTRDRVIVRGKGIQITLTIRRNS